jgi:hypothetical protein
VALLGQVCVGTETSVWRYWDKCVAVLRQVVGSTGTSVLAVPGTSMTAVLGQVCWQYWDTCVGTGTSVSAVLGQVFGSTEASVW